MLRDLFSHKGSFVSLRCGNETGKTSTVITTAVLYSIEILKAQVISTAGVWMQVANQLIPNLKKYSHLFPEWRFLDDCIMVNGRRRYIGFSTRDEGFAQGFHREEGMPLVALIDEAAAVIKAVFDGVEDRCNPDFFLVTGSPLDPEGPFYDIEVKLAAHYTHHHISQTDCLTTDGYWIKPESIARKIAKYGSKDHPFIQSNVYGEFASRVADGLLSLREFNRCLYAETQHRTNIEDRHFFIDVGVTNCAACRHGNKVWIERIFVEENIPAICGNIMAMGSDLERRIGLKRHEISIDGSGDWGKKVFDGLASMGFHVNRWYGQQSPSDPDYRNKISEAWIGGAGLIKSCDMIIPDNDNFRTQCLTRKQFTGAGGKLMLESKEDYIDRMKCDSPHEGDAIFGAMTKPVTSQPMILGSHREREPDQRSWRERAWDESSHSGDFEGEEVLRR